MRATAEHLEPYRRWRTSYRSEGRELAGFWLTPDGDEPVRGSVAGDAMTLMASRRGFSNPWHPVLRGRLVPAASGSQLHYRVGWTYAVSVFTAVWLAGTAAAFLLGAGAALARVAAGDLQAASGPAILTAAAGGLLLYAMTLMTFAGWLSRDEIPAVLAWRASHLDGPNS